jgi:hypothetical protein
MNDLHACSFVLQITIIEDCVEYMITAAIITITHLPQPCNAFNGGPHDSFYLGGGGWRRSAAPKPTKITSIHAWKNK